MIVADCSVIAPLFVETSTTVRAEAVFARDPVWVMPPLWRAELRSVVRKYMLHRSLSLELAIDAVTRVERIFADADRPVASADVLRIVQRSGCSAYDAEYVAVAEALGLPLITEDRQLSALFPAVALSPERYLELSDGRLGTNSPALSSP